MRKGAKELDDFLGSLLLLSGLSTRNEKGAIANCSKLNLNDSCNK